MAVRTVRTAITPSRLQAGLFLRRVLRDTGAIAEGHAAAARDTPPAASTRAATTVEPAVGVGVPRALPGPAGRGEAASG